MVHNDIIEIGKPGKFDKVFGLVRYQHPAFSEPLYVVVFKDTGEQVMLSGGFVNPIHAENWVKNNRDRIIEENLEKIILG